MEKFHVWFLTNLTVYSPPGKDGQYRDTGSVEPGSRQNFGSVSGSENQLLGIFYTKDTFSLY